MSLEVNGVVATELWVNGTKATEAWVNGTKVINPISYAIAGSSAQSMSTPSCGEQSITYTSVANVVWDGASNKTLGKSAFVDNSSQVQYYLAVYGGTTYYSTYDAYSAMALGKRYSVTIQGNLYTSCTNTNQCSVGLPIVTGATSNSSSLYINSVLQASTWIGQYYLAGELLKIVCDITITSATDNNVAFVANAYKTGFGSLTLEVRNLKITVEEI